MTTALLELVEVEVTYDTIPAVKGVSLHVDAGEIVGLVGANGAGKSSTLAAVSGLVAASGGEVRLDGTSLTGRPSEEISHRGLSLVPEGRHVFASLTVEENLSVGLRRNAGGDHTVASMMERFPVLGRYRNTPAGRLSGGEQQQLVIARALLTHPRVLLLDEPTLGLAPLVVNQVFELLEEFRSSGMAVLLVEQHVDRVIQTAQRTHVIRNGRVCLAGTREELQRLDSREIRSAYLGESA